VAKKPDPQAALQQLYKDLPKEELARQGREFLENKVDAQARRARRIAAIAMWSAILGAIVLGGGFCMWLLFKAKQTGSTFGEMKNEALKAYIDND
jgi:hypothetical protein